MFKALSITLSLCFILQGALASAKTLVISDVDDTVKISYVRHKVEMVTFSAFSDSLFFGMNQVYQGLKNETDAEFFYVSNGWTPTVAEVHQRLLQNFDFPTGQYLSRNNPLNKDFKFQTISKIISEQNPDTVVLIGDNGEKDAVTYQRIAQAFRDQGIVFHTYIHQVYADTKAEVAEIAAPGSNLPEGQHGFANAAELSQLLSSEGLQGSAENLKVIKSVRDFIFQQKPNSVLGPLVVPFFKRCQSASMAPKLSCRKVFAPITVEDQMLKQIQQRTCELVSNHK